MPKMKMPKEMNNTDTWDHIAKYEFIYSLCGLILGTICILGGIVLFLRGITGSSSWTTKILGADSKISDAAPGAILFIVGLFIVYVTRFVVESG